MKRYYFLSLQIFFALMIFKLKIFDPFIMDAPPIKRLLLMIGNCLIFHGFFDFFKEVGHLVSHFDFFNPCELRFLKMGVSLHLYPKNPNFEDFLARSFSK